MFLGWAVKLTVLRAAGLLGYRKAIPFFAGLVLGDYAIGAAWDLFGVALSTPAYRIWPN